MIAEVMQVCNGLGIPCICVQPSVECGEKVHAMIGDEQLQQGSMSVCNNEDEENGQEEQESVCNTETEENSQENLEKAPEQQGETIDTADLLSELDALANADSEGNVRRRKHIGLKKFATRSKSKTSQQ